MSVPHLSDQEMSYIVLRIGIYSDDIGMQWCMHGDLLYVAEITGGVLLLC